MDEVEELIEQLKSEDVEARRNAADRLGDTKDKRAVPALIEKVKDKKENVGVREKAAWALGRIGEASAVPALIGALKDEVENVRMWAAEALREIGDASAVPPLIEASKDKESFVRYSAVKALGQIGDVSVVPALVDALKENKYLVQVGAIYALWKVVEKSRTTEELAKIEKGIDDYSTELRKRHGDKSILINAQIEVAKLTREIAERKDALAPKRDLLLDGKPKPPKRGRGIYHTARMVRNG